MSLAPKSLDILLALGIIIVVMENQVQRGGGEAYYFGARSELNTKFPASARKGREEKQGPKRDFRSELLSQGTRQRVKGWPSFKEMDYGSPVVSGRILG